MTLLPVDPSRPIGVGVLGARSRIFRHVLDPAIAAVDGIEVVHLGSLGGADGVTGGARGQGGSARVSGDYEAVLADPDVDLVYVPLPNHLHEPWVLACADAGKHVVCEKPLAIDASSARRMADACERAGVVLLEAYMSPYHPRSQAVQAAVADGMIGDLRHGEARMAGRMPHDDHRWSVANGGGALLDLGIYTLEPVLWASGWDGRPPVEVAASAVRGGDGVDDTMSAWLDLGGGLTHHLWVSFSAPADQRLTLTGTDGSIEVDFHATPLHDQSSYRLRDRNGQAIEVPTASGSCYEGLVAHVRDVLRGEAAPLRPASRSVALAQLLDAIAEAAS